MPWTWPILSVMLSGCVPYPVYKTLQPAAKLTVLDARGQAVSGAEVTLVSSAYPYGWEKSRETRTTAGEGTAGFPARREWRTEALVIHGWEEFFWNWCVRKDGFETFATEHRSASAFDREQVVTLAAGQSKPCPSGLR